MHGTSLIFIGVFALPVLYSEVLRNLFNGVPAEQIGCTQCGHCCLLLVQRISLIDSPYGVVRELIEVRQRRETRPAELSRVRSVTKVVIVAHDFERLILIHRPVGTGRKLARVPVPQRRIIFLPGSVVVEAGDEHLVALLKLVIDGERHGNGRRKFDEVEARRI